MRKHIYYSVSFVCSILALLLSGCSDMDLDSSQTSGNSMSLAIEVPSSDVDVSTPDGMRRVKLSEIDGTKNLKAQWQSDDEVQIIIRQDDKVYHLGKVKVSNISQDGKQATLNMELPGMLYQNKPYTMYCFTGVDGSLIDNDNGTWSAYCRMELQRSLKTRFRAPMFAQVEVSPYSSPLASFKHIGTYELLHFKNEGTQNIPVEHCGFNVEKPWYQGSKGVIFDDSYDHTQLSGEWDGDSDSPSLTIPVGSEGVFISVYMPSGFKVQDAQLVTRINGVTVSSVNRKSSNATIQRGHAYHMYATWDGTALRFVDGSDNTPQSYLTCPDSNHPHIIDLGLPSGNKWACCNVGADKPEGYGGYYAWGETEEKDYYSWGTYIHCDGSRNTCHYLGCSISGTQYDVAQTKWGGHWQMPTAIQLVELDECAKERIEINGVQGIKFTGPSGGCIFLPGAGSRHDFDSYSGVTYQSGTPYDDDTSFDISFGLSGRGAGSYRCEGIPVRPIYVEKEPLIGILNCPDNNHPHQIDLGLPSGTKWACCNVGATLPESYGGYYKWGQYENDNYTGDGESICGTKYDVAYMMWGGNWKLPTEKQVDELVDNCSYTIISKNGVAGMVFTGSNGYAIFLPFAGLKKEGNVEKDRYEGNYLIGTCDNPIFSIEGDGAYSCWSSVVRFGLCTVRPINKK